MPEPLLAQRLRRLPVATVLGREVRVALGPCARFLGLAHLNREEVGAGLLIPHCSSVHTLGMRLPLDLYFLGEYGEVVTVRREVGPRHLAFCARARAVLEVPAGEGGENLAATS
ncbi:MAG TPA: DUF192 domain-containing protein [Solirubrobacterales bacterium]|nr:DUF192 domain-containing protein [Solirubrobacterales bacterium]